MMNQLLFASFALSLLAASHGFAPAFRPQQLAGAHQQLGAVMISDYRYQDESTMMVKARECAFSDRSTIDDAQEYLHQILHVQSACAGGVLSGHDLCENQDEVAEIVAHLRQKIESGPAINISPENRSRTSILVLPTALALAMCAMIIASTIDWGQGITPFTLQEWDWAIKGGYADAMISHVMRNGGL